MVEDAIKNKGFKVDIEELLKLDGDRRVQSLNYIAAEKADIYQLEETENGKTQLSS